MSSTSAVATPGYRETLDRLRRAQKTSVGAPLYSRFVNRPLGRRFAALAFLADLRPNQVTGISALFTFSAIGVLVVAEPSWTIGFVVTLGLVVGYGLDAADGQLARLRGGGSLAGEWLDHVVDAVKVFSIHLAVLIMADRYLILPRWWLVVPILFAIAAALIFFAMLLNEKVSDAASLSREAQAARSPSHNLGNSTLYAVAKLPTDYGALILVFVLLGNDMAFAVVYSFLAVATLGLLLLALPKWYRDVGALEAGT